jgi:elongator complex protein 3
MRYATDEQIAKFSEIMHIKPTRIVSGVAVITVSCKPGYCPGNCIYCPPRSEVVPKSYSANEPAIQRAIRNKFHPFLQIKDRLGQYRIMSLPHDKIEVILLGGTFLAFDKEYKEWFIKGIFDGLNGIQSSDLEKAKKMNEIAKHRCVGLTIETRPDFCKEKHIDEMLGYGTTRVEIGVQSVYNNILNLVNRGHTVEDTVEAIRIAKDAGLKTVFHVMPGLPDSDFGRDLAMFRILFTDSRFMPDDLKIYPTAVTEGTKLHELWKEGKYNALTDEETRDLIVEIKKITPPFVRFRRVLRDIPSNEVIAGPKKSNMRELALNKMKELGLRCRCTRCREVGHAKKLYGIEPKMENIKLIRRDYEASEGKEIFLSFEDTEQDILIGLLRLRIPSEKAHRFEINKIPSSIVREIHTYGNLVSLDKNPGKEWQHRGYGKELLDEAEKISKEEFDRKKIVVISGVGVKQYFLKQGYQYDGVYVSKII